jgi:hypothetical protein
MDIDRANEVLVKAIMGLQQGEVEKLLSTPAQDAVPWDGVEEWRGRRRQAKYPGLMGNRFDAAMKKGYIDFGLIDPKNASMLKRYGGDNLGEKILMLLDAKGVAFIRDPEGILSKSGLSTKDVVKSVRDNIKWMYDEMRGNADEYGAHDEAAIASRARRIADKAKISVQPVKGKTGAGYKVTTTPSLSKMWAQAKAEYEKASAEA